MNITTIPAPRVNLIDERTGLMSREWYLFFMGFFNESTDTSVTDSVFSLQLMENSGEVGYKTSLSDDEIKGQLAMISNHNPPVEDVQALNWM